MKDKITYFLKSFLKSYNKPICPSCNSSMFKELDRKYFVTKLLKCEDCNLYYRFPTDDENFNEQFYQEDYTQSDGITTYIPNKDELDNLLKNNFQGTAKNIKRYIDVILELCGYDLNNKKILDYGASWGYISYQLMQAGMDVESYEISKSRAKAGEIINVNIKTEINQLRNENDIFFSSHVIEHVPNVNSFFDLAIDKVKKNGYILTFCPNGTLDFKKTKPKNFHSLWGLVHPNMINEELILKKFKDFDYFIDSESFDISELNKWVQNGGKKICKLTGDELLIIVKK